MKDGKKNLIARNASSSTPANLIASVLEQRYAHKSTSNIKGKDEKPDPMTFPAMQKALGSVYSTLVEIVDEENELAEGNISEKEISLEETAENICGMNEQLLDMVSEIEQREKHQQENKKALVVEVQKKKNDPYNRAVNFYSEPDAEIDTIDIPDEIEFETFVSVRQNKTNRRFRNEA